MEGINFHIFKLKDKANVRSCDTHGNEVLRAEAVREGDMVTVCRFIRTLAFALPSSASFILFMTGERLPEQHMKRGETDGKDKN